MNSACLYDIPLPPRSFLCTQSQHLCSFMYPVCGGDVVKGDMSSYRRRQVNLFLSESQMVNRCCLVVQETEVQLWTDGSSKGHTSKQNLQPTKLSCDWNVRWTKQKPESFFFNVETIFVCIFIKLHHLHQAFVEGPIEIFYYLQPLIQMSPLKLHLDSFSLYICLASNH